MSTRTWRCLLCGTSYVEHVAGCTGCLETGTVVQFGVRPRAAIDGQAEVTTASALARASFTLVVSQAYPTIRIGAGALMAVYGRPGSGKSSFVARLLDKIEGPVVLQSLEEPAGPSLHARLHRCHIRRDTFTILGAATTVDQLVDIVRSRSARALAIDSLQVASFTPEELRHLLIVLAPTLRLIVGICQVNKAGKIEGRERIAHEADVIVRVESMSWVTEKNRFDRTGVSGTVFANQEIPDANS